MIRGKSTNRFISNLMEDLKKTSQYLTEVYDFDDEEEMYGSEGEGMEPGMGEEPNPALVGQQQQGVNPQMQSEEEAAMHAQEVIQHEPIIGKIRETAIEGLKKYADHPTSSLYEFFKKVFLESDKVLTDSGNGKN